MTDYASLPIDAWEERLVGRRKGCGTMRVSCKRRRMVKLQEIVIEDTSCK